MVQVGVRVGVLLSGCGFLDGAEIRESVLTLLSLDRAGAEAVCLAPAISQHHVVDHAAGKPARGETRNVLAEAARIARGKIRDLASVQAEELDALILPGGYGVAKNLCNFAEAGEDAQVHPEVLRLVREMHQRGRPIGAICIAPALIAAAFREQNARPRLTLGTDNETAAKLVAMGAEHEKRTVKEVTVDRKNLLVSTPAYMFGDARVSEVAEGIDRLVREVLNLIPK